MKYSSENKIQERVSCKFSILLIATWDWVHS